MARSWSIRAALFAFVVLIFHRVSPAGERSGADLLPPSTVLYAELPDTKPVLSLLLDHPLSKRIQAIDDYQKSLQSPQFLQVKAGVALVEAKMGMPWRPLIEALTGNGIYIGFDLKSQGVALLAHAKDTDTPKRLLETYLELERSDAILKGTPQRVQSGEYRGFTAYSIGEAKFAVAQDWFIVCNKDELGKSILDRILDGGESLAGSASFKEAREKNSEPLTAWGFADIARVRELGVAKDAFKGPVDNPIAELLFGGIVSNLQKTPYATLELSLSDTTQRIALSAPHDASWVGEAREYYFGPGGAGQAPAPLQVSNLLFTLRTYRNFAGMWLRAGDLFNDKINDDFAKADSQLATLFSGKDFGEDILGAIQPEIQIVVARQTFEEAKDVPTIKLPTFALVSRLKDTKKMQPELRRIFQSLIGFLNIVGSMNGQPQFEIDIEKEAGWQVISATYLPDVTNMPGKINYNFSPSVSFSDDYFIVASTRQLAHTLAVESNKTDSSNTRPVNMEGTLNYSVLRDVLHDNRGKLVAQTMLQKGKTKEDAEKEIDLTLNLLEFLQDSQLRLTAGQKLRLEFETNLRKPEALK